MPQPTTTTGPKPRRRLCSRPQRDDTTLALTSARAARTGPTGSPPSREAARCPSATATGCSTTSPSTSWSRLRESPRRARAARGAGACPRSRGRRGLRTPAFPRGTRSRCRRASRGCTRCAGRPRTSRFAGSPSATMWTTSISGQLKIAATARTPAATPSKRPTKSECQRSSSRLPTRATDTLRSGEMSMPRYNRG